MKATRKHSEAGMSLISVMFGVAIVGILIAVINSLASNNMRASKMIERQGQMEDIRRLIRMRLDCAATKSHITSGKNIVLYGRDGKAIAKTNTQNQMLVGKWAIEVPSYSTSNGQFKVLAIHPAQKNQNLFIYAPLVCTP
jgi:type II secretory pathway pseudopilin PulG